VDFHRRYCGHFQRKTRSVFGAAGDYLKGLMQAKRKNMERMEETVVEADEQRLQHMLTESDWDHRAVLDQVAEEANEWLGGTAESCFLVDESGFAKKGKHSVGVARQWNGRQGKVDNCQVGVFGALGKGHLATLTDLRLYLPKDWVDHPARCRKAGVPEAERDHRTKTDLALEMVRHQRALGIAFAWVGADGGYGKEPAFLRGLEAMGEIFVADVHKDQRIYVDDPQPQVPAPANEGRQRGRPRSRLQAQTEAQRVDEWVAARAPSDWKPVELRDSTEGRLKVEVVHRRVWLWDGKEQQPRHWHLIVRREIDSPQTLKYTLCNAEAALSTHRLAQMQAQRFWVERAFQEAKSHCGMAEYQARKWRAWHHHMTLVAMSLLFMLEERIAQKDRYPLLSCSDIETLLKTTLPRRDLERDEVIRQMEKRHRKRLAATEAQYRKQGLPIPQTIGAVNLTK
jgi:SRSO17 transposase